MFSSVFQFFQNPFFLGEKKGVLVFSGVFQCLSSKCSLGCSSAFYGLFSPMMLRFKEETTSCRPLRLGLEGILQKQKELGRNPDRLDLSGYPEALLLQRAASFFFSFPGAVGFFFSFIFLGFLFPVRSPCGFFSGFR